MRRLSVLALVPMLAAALALAACGEGTVAAATIVRNVPAKTEKAKTARMAINVTGSGGGSQAINVTADGVIDITSKRGDLTMDLGQAGLGKMRVLMFGTLLYVQLPPQLQGQIPGGKPFLKLDLTALSKQQGLDLGALTQQNPDASSQLAILNGAGSDFKKVGSEKLRGTSTTHYAGTVDLTKAAAAATTPEKKAALDKVREQLGTSTFPVDVWVDGQGRLRKLTYKMDLSKAAAASKSGVSGEMNVNVELFDYGVPVNVTEPPADQATDLSALLGGLGSGQSKRP